MNLISTNFIIGGDMSISDLKHKRGASMSPNYLPGLREISENPFFSSCTPSSSN